MSKACPALVQLSNPRFLILIEGLNKKVRIDNVLRLPDVWLSLIIADRLKVDK